MSERRIIQLLARYRVANLDEFVERHVADLASSGVFVRTDRPLAVGSYVELECRGVGDEPLLAALGRVVRVRDSSDAVDGHPAGMALQFLRVDKATQRALEMAERSSRFGLRFDAEDRTWSDQQRVSPALSTPPPASYVQTARIEMSVDASMAPPASEIERTPPLFAALLGGDSLAFRPARIPAGFEGLFRMGSEPDSSEVAAVSPPRSAIARPFGPATPVSIALDPEVDRTPPSGMPVSEAFSSGGDTVPMRSASMESAAPASEQHPTHEPEPTLPDVAEGPLAAPLAAAGPNAGARAAAALRSQAGLWLALAVLLAGAVWVARWVGAVDSSAPSGTGESAGPAAH